MRILLRRVGTRQTISVGDEPTLFRICSFAEQAATKRSGTGLHRQLTDLLADRLWLGADDRRHRGCHRTLKKSWRSTAEFRRRQQIGEQVIRVGHRRERLKAAEKLAARGEFEQAAAAHDAGKRARREAFE
ncbi:hypothetical protein JIX56_32105 [Streptomyces sp. CA-210063]|uniref:hypothetical protein n=1 Tax=Streptomyces sp. CA-210063 TaxID=2801029 RepID=UPI00214B9ECC|nr:hypothetical protein JIX56_32105 [Streptomyces sp. CA-210063]